MARTNRTADIVTRGGLAYALTSGDNANGEKILLDGSPTFLHVKAPAGGGTFTIKRPGTVDGDAVPDKTISFGANAEKMISLVPDSLYKQSDGYAYIDYPASGWTAQAFKITGT